MTIEILALIFRITLVTVVIVWTVKIGLPAMDNLAHLERICP